MSSIAQNDSASILLIEDNPTDVMMTREAFAENKIQKSLHVAEDGIQAIEFLRSANKPPELIILDLNLPRMSGREFLDVVKSDTDLKSIPVVVLTTSKAEEDVSHAYTLHANSYITKPVDFSNFVEVIRTLNEFWFDIVTLPSANH